MHSDNMEGRVDITPKILKSDTHMHAVSSVVPLIYAFIYKCMYIHSSMHGPFTHTTCTPNNLALTPISTTPCESSWTSYMCSFCCQDRKEQVQ